MAIALFSCKTSEDLTYLKDMNDQELQDHLPKKPADYRIKQNDNLYVKILTHEPGGKQCSFSQNPAVNTIHDRKPTAILWRPDQPVY